MTSAESFQPFFSDTPAGRNLHREVLCSKQANQKSFCMKIDLQRIIKNPLHLDNIYVFIPWPSQQVILPSYTA